MLDLESMISAQRVVCVKKYVEIYESPWKYVLDFYLKKVGGKFLFECNFDNRTLSITLPIFYRECLQALSSITNYDSSSYEGLMNQIIWNNKYILSEGKSIFQSVFYNLGILKVGDLVSKEGVFLKSDKILKSSFSPCYSFALMGVFGCLDALHIYVHVTFFLCCLSRFYLYFIHSSHTDTQQQRHQKSRFVS